MGYWPSPAKVSPPPLHKKKIGNPPFFMCDDLSFTNTTQKNFKTFQKNVLIPKIDEKKLHTLEFQLKGIGGNMRCKLLQKRSAGKTTECSKHLRHIGVEKDIFSEINRCIFQISLKYIYPPAMTF